MPALTIADYQAATGSTDAAAAQIAIDDAIAALATYTDRDFDSTPVTESRDYTYRGTGFLEIDDAAEVTEVSATFPIFQWYAHSDGPAGFDVVSWLELPILDRRSMESMGQMGFTRNLDKFFTRGGSYPWEWTVTVTGTFGVTAVPNDVRRGLIYQAQEYEKAAASDASGPVSSETVAETSRSYVIPAPPQPSSTEDAGYSPRATALWWPYRRHVL